jgi:hypothetical protein
MILSASKGQNQPPLLLAQLHRDWLLYIEAMNDEIAAVIGAAWERARQQARHRAKGVALRAWRKPGFVDRKTRAQRQSRIERAPRGIDAGSSGLMQKSQHEADDENWVQGPSARQKQQTYPGCSACRQEPDQEVRKIETSERQPKREKTDPSSEKAV